jgi:hypothetical protein
MAVQMMRNNESAMSANVSVITLGYGCLDLKINPIEEGKNSNRILNTDV